MQVTGVHTVRVFPFDILRTLGASAVKWGGAGAGSSLHSKSFGGCVNNEGVQFGRLCTGFNRPTLQGHLLILDAHNSSSSSSLFFSPPHSLSKPHPPCHNFRIEDTILATSDSIAIYDITLLFPSLESSDNGIMAPGNGKENGLPFKSRWNMKQLAALWDVFVPQLHPFTRVLCVEKHTWRLLDDEAKRFLAQNFMSVSFG